MWIYCQVEVVLVVVLFRVGEGIVDVVFFVLFDYRKWRKGFIQYFQFCDMYGNFVYLGMEYMIFYFDVVVYIQQFFEDFIVYIFVFFWVDFILCDVDLNMAGVVLQFSERSFVYDMVVYKVAGEVYILEIWFIFFVIEFFLDFFGVSGYVKGFGRERVDVEFMEFFYIFLV